MMFNLQDIIDIQELYVLVCSFLDGPSLVRLELLSKESLSILRKKEHLDILWKGDFNFRFGYFSDKNYREEYKRILLKFKPCKLKCLPYKGFMKKYIGEQYTEEEILKNYSGDEIYPDEEDEYRERFVSENLRCFEIPSLKGQTFESDDEDSVKKSLFNKLAELLPGHKFDPSNVRIGPLRKYKIFHVHINAGIDQTTGQKMYITVYGPITKMKGMDFRSEECTEYRKKHCQPPGDVTRYSRYNLGFEGKLEFRFNEATLSSERFCGVNMPWYS